MKLFVMLGINTRHWVVCLFSGCLALFCGLSACGNDSTKLLDNFLQIITTNHKQNLSVLLNKDIVSFEFLSAQVISQFELLKSILRAGFCFHLKSGCFCCGRVNALKCAIGMGIICRSFILQHTTSRLMKVHNS